MRIKRCLVIFAVLAITLTLAIGTAAADGIQVYPGDSIQSAVNNANNGDMILVYPGIYTENVIVNKSLTIASHSGNPDNTIVQAAAPNYAVFKITTDNTTISGFNVTGATDTREGGIYLKESSKCSVINNFLFNNERGILLRNSNSNIIDNNIAESSVGDDGIQLYYSNDNIISNNNASNNPTGIGIHHSSNNTITNNIVFDNAYGIFLRFSSNSSLIDNKALNNGMGIQIGVSNNNILNNNNASANGCGILIDSSKNNILLNNIANKNVPHNGIGIHSFSYNNTLLNNTANSNQWSGIYVEESSNNNILSNNASSNICGIAVIGADNNVLKNNTVSNNTEEGVLLTYGSSNNTIYNNYFSNTNNVESVNDYGTNVGNIWNITKTSGTNIIGGPYIGGNFWANPNGTGFSQTCEDGDGDGICDSPYYIDENNIDYLPLSVTIAEFEPQAYDINEDGTIQKNEVINAIIDYFDSLITKNSLFEVIVEYFRESRITINAPIPDTGEYPYFSVVNEDYERLSESGLTKTRESLPTEAESVKIANQYIKDYGGYPEGIYLSNVETAILYEMNHETGEIVNEYPEFVKVDYNRHIDGMPVAGPGDTITVCIGDDGEILYYFKTWRTLEKAGNKQMISAEEAIEKLKNGDTIQNWMCTGRMEINKIEVGYFSEVAGSEQVYYEPVWIFRGVDDHGYDVTRVVRGTAETDTESLDNN